MAHYQTENKFQNFRMMSFIETLKNSIEHSMYLIILEIVIMIGLGVFQVAYIKKVLDNKRMI